MSAAPWVCRRCAVPDVVCNGAVWVPGSYRDPPSPSVRCAGCDAPPSDAARVLAALTAAAPAVPAAPSPAAAYARRPLSLNKTARRLGWSKTKTRRLANEGAIRTVPWTGKKAKDAFPLEEIERVEREGIPKRQRARGKRGVEQKAAAEVAAREAKAIREYAKG